MRRTRVDLEPEIPRAGKVGAVVVYLLLVTIIVAVFWQAKADAATVRTMRVHQHPGQWGSEPAGHPRMVVAPKGTQAARQMRAAYPGDLYRLTGASHGRFVVTGVIDVGKGRGRLFDRRMHVDGTAFYVYLDRVVKP